METLDKYPISLRKLIQTIYGPNDNYDYLVQQIEHGKMIWECDGSLMTESGRKYGGHTFALQMYNNNKYGGYGWGITPTSNTVTPTATEHYGVITILLLLHKYMSQNKSVCKNM